MRYSAAPCGSPRPSRRSFDVTAASFAVAGSLGRSAMCCARRSGWESYVPDHLAVASLPDQQQAVAPLLAIRGVTKRFGAVQALAGVDLELRAGEIHALLGENGAGKSTLMNMLYGVQRPDSGTILVGGRPVRFASPRQARAAGIGMVHQHFALVDALSVAENLALSLPRRSHWRLDRAGAAEQACRLAKQIGIDLGPPAVPVSSLSVGARQRLEIINALAAAGRVLILDEPTAVLTPQEVRQLFSMLRRLRAQGRLVIFITHKLREMKEVADRVTVMRRGRIVGTYAVGAVSEGEMAECMLGELAPALRRSAAVAGAPVLQVSQLSTSDRRGARALVEVSFAVRRGEILGVAGVDGNGQRELFEVLAGVQAPAAGHITVGDQTLTDFTPPALLAAGIAHIPPDRHREGLVLAMSVEENLLLNRTILDRFSRCGVLRRGRAHAFAVELTHRYGIRPADLGAPVRSLSGGNQQRVVVARELAQAPRVLVAVNPTRGLDVAAARAVSETLIAIARRGCAIVLISTDLDEVIELSDRVSVLARGRLSAALEPPVDPEQLGLLMAGAVV
jgi:general nucleoside transport system ATP-binding protein